MNDDIINYKKSINDILYSNKKQNEIIVGGQGNIMLSCPHCVVHKRNGNAKYPEEDTAILAYLVHEKINTPYIYKVNSDKEDANYDLNSEYKNKLVKYIKDNDVKILLDLHELNKDREEIVNLGIGHGNNINDINVLNLLIREISSKKIGMISIDKPFSASGESVISTYVHDKCEIDCVQIEMNSGFFMNEIHNFELFSDILVNCIKKMEENFSG